jgi:hypothetical protein
LTVLAVTILAGEGYKVTCPKITVNCKLGVSQHKIEYSAALFVLAS